MVIYTPRCFDFILAGAEGLEPPNDGTRNCGQCRDKRELVDVGEKVEGYG